MPRLHSVEQQLVSSSDEIKVFLFPEFLQVLERGLIFVRPNLSRGKLAELSLVTLCLLFSCLGVIRRNTALNTVTMDSQSRHTASEYINNLLLSRGLLRNGIPIPFANPDEVEGGVGATMVQVMNLVHDFILRRDV